MIDKQRGVTLLEVLVGFVIFTSSIVAVMDYVTQQVYLLHRSNNNHEKAQFIYDLTDIYSMGSEQQVIESVDMSDLDWNAEAVVLESFTKKRSNRALVKSTYTISDPNSKLVWDVLAISNQK